MADVLVHGRIKIVATPCPPPAGIKVALYTDYVQSWFSFLDRRQNSSLRGLLCLQERFHVNPMSNGPYLSLTVKHGIVNRRLLEQWLTVLHENFRIVGQVTIVIPAHESQSAHREPTSIKWTFNKDGSLDKEKGKVPARIRYTV